MQKLTIFTVFVAIIVLSVIFELGVKDEKSGEDFLANVMADETYGEKVFDRDSETASSADPPRQTPPPSSAAHDSAEPLVRSQPSQFGTSDSAAHREPDNSDSQALLRPAASPNSAALPASVFSDLVKEINSAFSFETEVFSNKVFQLLDVSDVTLEFSSQGNLKNNEAIEAVIFEMQAVDEVMAAELYQLLKKKTVIYSDISVNETNKYGDGSFYINHIRKPNEVFLVVRLKNKIYAFAYEKTFHDNIVKLISLLTFVQS